MKKLKKVPSVVIWVLRKKDTPTRWSNSYEFPEQGYTVGIFRSIFELEVHKRDVDEILSNNLPCLFAASGSEDLNTILTRTLSECRLRYFNYFRVVINH